MILPNSSSFFKLSPNTFFLRNILKINLFLYYNLSTKLAINFFIFNVLRIDSCIILPFNKIQLFFLKSICEPYNFDKKIFRPLLLCLGFFFYKIFRLYPSSTYFYKTYNS